MEILGVRIDNFTKIELLQKIKNFLDSDKQCKIFTPNPEMLVLAQQFSYFKEVLNRGDLNLCDGFGITLVSLGKIKRIPGSDFIWDLCKIAQENDKSIFLLGSGDEKVLSEGRKALNTKFAQLKIVGTDIGPKIRIVDGKIELSAEENNKLINKVNESGAEIIFVAFGQIKQEIWIEQFLPNLPKIKLAIGIGGALDYISGKVKRAPKFLRAVGLEWLWRLINEPKRIKRIFNATFKFIYYYFK